MNKSNKCLLMVLMLLVIFSIAAPVIPQVVQTATNLIRYFVRNRPLAWEQADYGNLSQDFSEAFVITTSHEIRGLTMGINLSTGWIEDNISVAGADLWDRADDGRPFIFPAHLGDDVVLSTGDVEVQTGDIVALLGSITSGSSITIDGATNPGEIRESHGLLSFTNDNLMTEGNIRWVETGGGLNYTGLQAPAALTGDTIYTWMNGFPAGNYLLQSTNAGVWSWVDPAPYTACCDLDETYDASASGAKTITVDDGEFELVSAPAYGIVLSVGNGDDIFQIYDDSCFVAEGDYGTGTAWPWAGAGTGLIWNPYMAALRAGRVTGTEWDVGNTGTYSTAFGLNATASANVSFAAGGGCTASGEGSVALGIESTASAISAFAFGDNASASTLGAIAMGDGATASGADSVAIGSGAEATGVDSFAFGTDPTSSGNSSFALGNVNTAGDWSFATGNHVELTAAADYSVLFGYKASAPYAQFTAPQTFNIYGLDFVWYSANESNGIFADASAETITVVATEGLYIGDVDDVTPLCIGNGLGNYVTLTAAAMGADYGLTLPPADGDVHEVIITDGSEGLSFTDITGIKGYVAETDMECICWDVITTSAVSIPNIAPVGIITPHLVPYTGSVEYAGVYIFEWTPDLLNVDTLTFWVYVNGAPIDSWTANTGTAGGSGNAGVYVAVSQGNLIQIYGQITTVVGLVDTVKVSSAICNVTIL